MRYKIVFKILGFITMFLGASMLLPLPFSFYYGGDDVLPLSLSSGITMAVGALAFFLFKTKQEVRPKEGFLIVALGWIVFSALGALPYMLGHYIPSFTDAFFETMSGFTTTGATILTDIEALPEGILFWRSFTHWVGGMGIIVLGIAILPLLGVGGMQLFKAEVPGPIADKLTPRVTETAKILWGVYVLLSVIETILLMLGGMNLHSALCHTFGTMATGGYSTMNASVGGHESAYIDYVIIIFMIIAGMNFSLHYRLLKGNIKEVLLNRELQFYFAIITFATLIIGVDTYMNNYSTILETLRYTLFQVVSIITTTGYGTADYEQWSISSQLVLFLIMFVGGMAGSTGGGMKVMRVYLLIKFVYAEIVRLVHPQAIVPVRMGDITVSRDVMMNILGFFVLYMLIAAFSSLFLSFFGIGIATSIGAVAATLNNIGPGLEFVGPTDNYAFLPDIVKWLLSVLMLLGRLEVYTVIILLAPSFWQK